MNSPKILLWDLETLPDPQRVMQVFPSIGNWPGRTFKANISTIICFGYKWLGDKEASCINAWDVPQDHPNDDGYLIHAAYEILKEADCLVTHNGKKFDLKVMNTHLIKYGLPPLHKIPHVDTKIVAKRISLYSNRLGDVSKFLGGEDKLENGGWDLWCRVQNGDKKAQELMTSYCKQDVEVLEQVFLGLRPLMTNTEVPNYNLYAEDGTLRCPKCGSDKLTKHGVRRRVTGNRQRYLCGDCGSTADVKINSKQLIKATGV